MLFLSIPLTLTAELGNPKTSIGRLMKSSVGDTFTMPNPEHVLVKVAGERIFLCRYWKGWSKCCNFYEAKNIRE